MSALDELRTYAEGDGAWAFEVKEVLARLDAAEEVCREAILLLKNPDSEHLLNLLHAAVEEWMELAEPKPEHELIWNADHVALYVCRCGWEQPPEVPVSAENVANAFAKHFHEASSGGAA